MRSFVALLRRELWEHKVFRGLPLALLVVVVLSNILLLLIDNYSNVSITIGSGGQASTLGALQRAFVALPPQELSLVVNGTLIVIGMIVNAVLMIMSALYLLDALYADRKDQSILFWKSLPISDTRTVLAKLVVAVVGIPLLILLTSASAGLLTVGIQGLGMSHIPGASTLLWAQAEFSTLWRLTALSLAQQELWYFPVTGWLLLCSAWSRKTPIVIAVVIPMLILFIDGALGARTGISGILIERLPLGILNVETDASSGMLSYTSQAGGFKFGLTIDGGKVTLNADSARNLLTDLEVWMGLLTGGLFVSLAVWLRRWRDDNL